MKKAAANTLLILSLLYFAILSSWYICYSNDFYYPMAYVSADIGGHIQRKAQSDKEYETFASAGGGQHVSLFHRLLQSIEQGGKGLDALSFSSGKASHRFLNSAEAESLKDIADVLVLLKKMVRPFFLLAVMVCGWMAAAKVRPYTWRQTARVLSYLFTAFVAVLYFYGFERCAGLISGVVFGTQSELLFSTGTGLLPLLIPYPGVYMFLWATYLVTVLGCLGVLYLMTGAVVKAFIGRKYL
jgi:hypothetical protein